MIVFLNSTRFSRQHIIPFATMTTIFFSGRRGISRFLSFSFLSPFLSVGRSIKRRRRRRRRRIRREVCDGGLFGPSLLLLLLLRAREREREKIHKPPFWNMYQRVSLSLSRRPKDVCSKKSTFFVGKTDRPFRFFLPSPYRQNSLTTNEQKKKQTINLISLTTKNRFCTRRWWWCRGA